MPAGLHSTAKLRRLTRRAEFLNAARGRRAGRTSLALQATESADPLPGLGLTVTKKVGNAPERNRIRRRLRAAAGACSTEFRAQHDYVLVGRREALGTPFDKLCAELTSALGKVHAHQPAGS